MYRLTIPLVYGFELLIEILSKQKRKKVWKNKTWKQGETEKEETMQRDKEKGEDKCRGRKESERAREK